MELLTYFHTPITVVLFDSAHLELQTRAAPAPPLGEVLYHRPSSTCSIPSDAGQARAGQA